jgi:glycosyltransferase involved in cell wall biosynthesis
MTDPVFDVCVITTIHQPNDARIADRGIRLYTEAGLRVCVISTWPFIDIGVPRDAWIQTTPLRSRADRPRLQWETFRASRRVKARVYHFHDLDFLLWAVRLRAIHRRPVIYDCHEHYPEDIRDAKPWIPWILRRPLSAIVRVVEDWAVRRLHHCIVVVPSLAERFSALGAAPVLIRNFSRAEAQPDLSHAPALLYAGSISEAYGSRTLLEIGRELRRRGSPVPVVVPDRFSSDQLRADFRRAVESEGLPIRVVPQVPARELHRLMAQGAIGLVTDVPSPTMAHGMHAKFFDYMAAGLPIVAGDLANARRLLTEVGNGVLVTPGDAAAFVEESLRLLADPVRMESMRDRGFRAFTERFSWRLERDRLLAYVRALAAS